MPPAFSAKKVGGQRAYALARAATPVQLTPVPVTVARLDLLEFERRSRPREADLLGRLLRAVVRPLAGRLVGYGRMPPGPAPDAERRFRARARRLTSERWLGDGAAARTAAIPARSAADGVSRVVTALRIDELKCASRTARRSSGAADHQLAAELGAAGADGEGHLVALATAPARGLVLCTRPSS